MPLTKSEKAAETVKLSKKDLIKSWLTWICFAQTCYNFERLQGLGFCHSMIPILKKLYRKPEELASGLKRHLVFFNTESNWGSIIPGIVVSMEEEKANGAKIDDNTINGVKTALMGPMAGIGDSVTQGLVKIVLLAIGIDMAIRGNAFGPILYFTIFSIYTVGLSYALYMSGYRLGKSAVLKFLESNLIKDITEGLGAMSMMVVGGLAATRINLATPLVFTIGKTVIKLQEILNMIMPKILPAALLIVTFYFLKKSISPIKVLVGIFIIGFLLFYLGIIS